MSKSNYALVPSSSKPDSSKKEQRKFRRASLVKLFESPNRKLNILQVFDRNELSSPLFDLTDNRMPDVYQALPNMSFKSCSALDSADSMENDSGYHGYNKMQRRSLLRFSTASNFSAHPSRRGEAEFEAAICSKSNLLTDRSRPRMNVKTLRSGMSKNRNLSSSLKITELDTVRSYSSGYPKQDVSTKQIVLPYKSSQQTSDILSSSSNISISILEAMFNNLMTSVSESEMAKKTISYDCLDNTVSAQLLMGSDFSYAAEHPGRTPPPTQDNSDMMTMLRETIEHSVKLENNCGANCNDSLVIENTYPRDIYPKITDFMEVDESERISGTDSQQPESSTTDFSSGDDSRNLESNSTLGIELGVSSTSKVQQFRPTYVQPKRRSVQWNAEVDVIYYAGDTLEGKILRREMEPLREEVDQQARHNYFVKLAMCRNRKSTFNGYKFLDPWLTMFQK